MSAHSLCGDIGGTNTNLAIVEDNGKEITILEHETFPTTKNTPLHELINAFLEKHDIKPTAACFAIAGPVKNHEVIMPNAGISYRAKELLEQTILEEVLFLNDFEAVSYATQTLEEQDIKILNKGKPEPKGTRATIGPGTGLGKSILYWDEQLQDYGTLPSEGGNTDFPALRKEELDLIDFAKRTTGLNTISYEELVSGRGLELLYIYLHPKHPETPPTMKAKEISETRTTNQCSKETFEHFIHYLARAARNFALDTLATGGMYIAGGITAKNIDAFDTFMEIFTHNTRYRYLLEQIPVILIKNYDASIKGAAYALRTRKNQCLTL